MGSVASQLIEEVTAHAQSDSLEDALEICADGTYFPNNLHICDVTTYDSLQSCIVIASFKVKKKSLHKTHEGGQSSNEKSLNLLGKKHNQPASNLVPVLNTPSWIVLLAGQS